MLARLHMSEGDVIDCIGWTRREDEGGGRKMRRRER